MSKTKMRKLACTINIYAKRYNKISLDQPYGIVQYMCFITYYFIPRRCTQKYYTTQLQPRFKHGVKSSRKLDFA